MNRLVTMLPRRCTTVEAIGATATTIADAMIEAARITTTMGGTDSLESQRAGAGRL
jgi:hypothetical protein